MRRLFYALGTWTVLVTLGTVGYEYVSICRGVGSGTWRFRSVEPEDNPIRTVGWINFFRTREESVEFAQAAVEPIDASLDLDPRRVEIIKPQQFALTETTTTRISPNRIAYNEYFWLHFAVIVVEFADGTRWAKAVELPDPRTAGVIPIDFRTGRQLPPRKAAPGK